MKFGYTFEYFAHALLLIFFGLVCLFVHYLISIVLILFGILLLLIKSGIELDASNNRLRNYSEIFGFKFGKWIDASGLQRIDLNYTSESQTVKSLIHTDSLHTKTFDVFLQFEDRQEIEIASFTDYQTALDVLGELTMELNVNSKDWINEIREQAFQNRKLRRRK